MRISSNETLVREANKLMVIGAGDASEGYTHPPTQKEFKKLLVDELGYSGLDKIQTEILFVWYSVGLKTGVLHPVEDENEDEEE